MRRYIWAIALLLFCLTAQAADYYHLTDYVTTKNGSAISGASVNVYAANTTTTATAYTDFGGTIPVSWPLATDPNGMFECYLAQGNYDISITHSGRNIDTTWDNYMVGTGSDTLSYSSLDIIGTIAAEAFDASDWIDAGGTITGETVETTGLSVIGGTFTTGGTVTVGGDLFVNDQAQFAYDAVEEVYNFRVGPNVVTVEPYLEVKNDAYIYGNMYLHGKDLASGKVQAQVVAVDTLKPRTGDDIYVRAAHGQDDAILHTQFLELDPVDVTVSLPDAGLHTKGTFFLGTDDTLRFKNDAGDWATFGTSYVIPDPDVPVLSLPTTTLNYAYADSHVQKFGVGNSGDGILSWASDLTPSSTWIAAGSGLTFHDGAADSGYVGAGFDSVTIQLMWAQIDSGASLWDTVAVTSSYGNGEVVIHAEGQPLVGGGDYVVEANHPRLYFNENTIAAQRTKCKSAESALYDEFVTYVDDHLVGDSYPLGDVGGQGVQLGLLAYTYAMEQDTLYLHEAVECGQSLFDDFTATWYNSADVEYGMALFYDWCYEGFGATRKALFGDSLAIACSRRHASSAFMTNPAHSQIVVTYRLLPMALAIAGDGLTVGPYGGIDGDSLATASLDSIFAHSFGDYHICANLDSIARDGGGYEGDYSEELLGRLADLFWLWDYGTDYDPWPNSSNMTGYGDYLLYDTSARTEVVYYDVSEPTQYTLYAFGEGKQSDSDAHAGSRSNRMWLINMLATAYQDSTLIWLSDEYDDQTGGYINKPERWKHIVVQDTVLTAAAPTTPRDYTTAKWFDIGTVFMREGWDVSTASTDVWATYRHEQYPFGHAHADAGHFILGRGHDLLLIDSGEYYNSLSAHHRSYFQQTVAHNTITIKYFPETFLGQGNSGGQNLNDLVLASGDFPYTLGAYYDSLAGLAYRGIITDYAHRPDTLTYIRSDLTSAYSSAKVDTVRREFVWMEPDGVFLIYDYAYTVEDTFLQKSLFHTINNPTLNGDDTWTIVHGTSEATLTFYGNASAQEIGGSGYEFWADGQNYSLPPATDYHSDNGAYRIEALPTRSSKTRALVTIIETSVVGGADYGTVSTVAVGDYLGAVVNGDTLLFHKFGGTYQYRAQ